MAPPPARGKLSERRQTRNSPVIQNDPRNGTQNPNIQIDLTKCLALEGNPDICNVCSNSVVEGENALECEKCFHWWHSNCINMSDAEYNIARKFKLLRFICPVCDSKENNQAQGNNDQGADKDLKKQLAQLTNMLQNVLERLTKMESRGTGPNQQDLDKKIEDMVEAKIQDALEEQRAKESKKLNLIIVNLRESASANLQEAKEDDKKATEELIKEILPEDDIEIQNPIRLGKRQLGNKPRLLKISVSDEKTKWNIIKNSQKLNQNGRRQHKIYINPDQTQKEREEYKKLKEELDRRTKEGEPHLKIERVGNKRQVVSRPPQDEPNGDGPAEVNPQGGH